MHCEKCNWEYPLDKIYLESKCVGCSERIVGTVTEYLENPELGLVNDVRGNQVLLANELSQTYAQPGSTLIAEAGTGIGKSYAYLLPLMIKARTAPVVISTAKKTLQQQLFEKDIPRLSTILDRPIRAALLYGRSHYACRKHWETAEAQHIIPKQATKQFFNYSDSEAVEDIEAFVALPATNIKPSTVRYLQTLSANDCVASRLKCVHASICGFMKDRKAAREADIIVTNHWMVGYDILLSQTAAHRGAYGLFATKADTLIIDEAHKFDEVVRNALTYTINESLLPNILKALKKVAPGDVEDLFNLGSTLDHLYVQWRDLFNEVRANTSRQTITNLSTLAPLLTNVRKWLSYLLLPTVVTNYVDKCLTLTGAARTNYIKSILDEMVLLMAGTVDTDTAIETPADIADTAGTAEGLNCFQVYRSFVEILLRLSQLDVTDDQRVLYVEVDKEACIKSAPIDVAGAIRRYTKARFTNTSYLSATLTINNSFDYFARKVGVDPALARIVQYPTTFNYATQALLYLNSTMPAPVPTNTSNYRQALTTEVADLLNASKGNAFVLFTAKDDLDYVASNIGPQLRLEVEVISQLDSNARTALKQYLSTPNSALFGLKSFWEGVDIPGDKLRLVIITKLPFPNSKDPIINARCDRAGDRSFTDVLLPEMISDLRQGVGRLIRSKTDQGIVAILDSRLLQKSYKGVVLNSLGIPRMVTDKARVVRNLQFLAT